MGRKLYYTDEVYNDAAHAMVTNINLKHLYSKEDLLARAGLSFSPKHWKALRAAMSRTSENHGLGLRYDKIAQGWRVESIRTANNNLLWQDLQAAWLPAMKKDIVHELQSDKTAEDVVACLVDQGYNPVALATMLATGFDSDGIHLALPQPVIAGLLEATTALLPEMNRQTRERITKSIDEVERVAGLLKAKIEE